MIASAARAVAIGVAAVAVGLSALWGGFALWFQLPLEPSPRLAVIAAFLIAAALTLAGLFRGRPRHAYIVYAAAFLALLLWWGTIKPSNDRDFAPLVAHGVTGVVRGDVLTLQNVRNFSWRAPDDYTQRWEERSYDLSKLRTGDFFLVYFMGPLIAHSMVSFGFEDGRHLMFSIEIRPERHQPFSSIAGFFRKYSLVFLAADERDYLFLRRAQDEDVRLFRIRATPGQARELLLEYVREANRLAVRPQFYNTLTANCNSTIFVMIRSLFPGFPREWRIVFNGFLPGFFRDHGLVDTSIPLDELIRRAAVTDRIEPRLSEVEFGRDLREGLPDPNR